MDNRGPFAELGGWKGNLDHDLVVLAKRRAEQAHTALTLHFVDGDHALLEIPGFARNDPDRIVKLLAYAQRDRDTLIRLRDMADVADDMHKGSDPGATSGTVGCTPTRSPPLRDRLGHAALPGRPHRALLRLRHQTGARHGLLADKAYVLEAFHKLKEQNFQPEPGKNRSETTVMLDNGIRVRSA